jgi:hypothetical protein
MASTIPTSHVEGEEHRPFRWTALWIGAVLIAILAAAILVGALIHNLNQTRMVAIFAIGVVSFLGMLAIGRGSRSRGFDPAEIRTALTTSFTMVFFAAVGIFLFSTNSVGDFGRTLMDNLTSLFGVVIGFYFATSAAVEYAKVKEGGRAATAASEPKQGPQPALGREGPNGQATLAAEVTALRSAVEALTQKVDQGGG